MSTKGKRAAAKPWTEEKQKAAQAARNYIKLGDKRGQLLLSGAAKRWETDPNFVYVPSLRVAGTPQDIERILGADSRAHIAQGYTAASVQGAQRAAYEAELADLAANRTKGAKKAVAAADNGVSIARYAALVDEATVEGAARSPRGRSPRAKSASPKAKKAGRKSASPKAKKAGRKSASPKRKAGRKSASPKAKKAGRKSAGSPKGKRGARPLADKIAALSAGKVMDVSKLRVDGSGAKAIKVPTSARSSKVQVPGRMIVSDNKRGINAAAKLLGDEGLVAAWVGAHGGAGASRKARTREASGSRSRSASRSRSRSRSGSRAISPAQTLPMSPAVSSPLGVPALPVVRTSPRGGLALPTLPTVRAPTIGSPRGSPRL